MALSTNLVSYWKLDESSGNASDSVGSNTLTNSGTASYSAGKINNGVDFSATTKYLGKGSPSGLPSGTAAFTMATWVKFDNFSTARYFMSFGGTTNNTQVVIRCDSATSWVIDDNGVGTAFPAVSSMSTGTWYHIVYTYPGSGNVYTAYLNGVSIGTANNTRAPNLGTTNVSLGSSNNTSSASNLVGSMDEAGIWSRALTADEVSQLFNSGRGNAYPLTDSPSLYGGRSYWKLDESSGNASDSVGSITLTNNNTATYSAGKISNGLNLAGASSQYMTASSFTITAAFSLSMWVKNTATGVNGYMFSSPTISSTDCVDIAMRTDNKFSYSNFLVEVVSASTLSAGTWYHIVVTSDGTNSVLYLNGVSDATSAGVGHTSSAQTYNFGRRADNNSAHFNGSLDEAGIWDRALTSTEITSLYNSGSGLAYPWTASATATRGTLSMMGV